MARDLSPSRSRRRRSPSPPVENRRSRRHGRDTSRSPYSYSRSRRRSRSVSPRRQKSRSPTSRRRKSRSTSPRRSKKQRSRSSPLSPRKSSSPSLGSAEHRNIIEKMRKEEEEKKRRQREAEMNLIQEETAKRLEHAIQKKVEESLNNVEIKLEIQSHLEEGRKRVKEEVAIQLEKEKEAALVEARMKEELALKEKEELEKMLEENRKRVEEAQRREALEQQHREEERLRELEELQRQREEEMRRKNQQEEEERRNQMKLLVSRKFLHGDAVQIRSHAQKFFSKVVRDSGSNSPTPVEPIEIPPPRPKRKPMHPYPRKMAHTFNNEPFSLEHPIRSSSPNSPFSEAENQSPTSVLSAIAPDLSDQSLSPVSPAGCFQPLESVVPEPHSSPEGGRSSGAPSEQLRKDTDDCERDLVQEKSTRSLKLFGRTVWVTESHRPSSPTEENSSGQVCDPYEKKPVETVQQDSSQSGTNLAHLSSGVFYCLPVQKEDQSQGLPWWMFPGGTSFPYVPIWRQEDTEQSLNTKCSEILDNENQKEGSLTGSNSGSVNEEENMDNETQSVKLWQQKRGHVHRESSDKCLRGFVPYKKPKVERSSQSSSTTGEDREEDPRAGHCL